MKEEIWKDIPGYEGLYQISTFGNVRRLLRDGSSRLLKFTYVGGYKSYPAVTLSKNNKKKFIVIHSVMGALFLEKPIGKTQIDHINGNPRDNRIENLRWVTPKENINNPSTWPYMGIKRRVPIIQMDLDGNLIKEWDGIVTAAKALGLHKSLIGHCCAGKRKSTGGFKWCYKNK